MNGINNIITLLAEYVKDKMSTIAFPVCILLLWCQLNYEVAHIDNNIVTICYCLLFSYYLLQAIVRILMIFGANGFAGVLKAIEQNILSVAVFVGLLVIVPYSNEILYSYYYMDVTRSTNLISDSIIYCNIIVATILALYLRFHRNKKWLLLISVQYTIGFILQNIFFHTFVVQTTNILLLSQSTICFVGWTCSVRNKGERRNNTTKGEGGNETQ